MSSLPTQVEVKWMRDGDNLGCYACGKLNAGHQHVFARCIRAYADKIADREARAAYWVERHTAHAKGEAFTKPYLRPPPPQLTKEESAALVLQRTAERSITVEAKKVAGEKRKSSQLDAYFHADNNLKFEDVYPILDVPIAPPVGLSATKKDEEPPVELPKKDEEPPVELPTAKAPPAKAPTAKAPTAKAPTAKAPTAKAPKAKAPKAKEAEVATTTRPKRKTAGNIYKENKLNIIGRSYKSRTGSAQ
jgi:hypothetical protein